MGGSEASSLAPACKYALLLPLQSRQSSAHFILYKINHCNAIHLVFIASSSCVALRLICIHYDNLLKTKV